MTAENADVRDQLAGINAKLDVLVSRHETQSVQVADHETRIRGIERGSVTREELDAKGRRTITVVTLIVSGAGVLVALVFGLITVLGR